MTMTPSRLAALAADRSASPGPNDICSTTQQLGTQSSAASSSSSSSSSSDDMESDASEQPNPEANKDPETLLALLHTSLTCTICNDLFLRPHALACGHTFCFPCASNWLASAKRRCPLCRTRVFRRPCFVYPLAEAVAHVRGQSVADTAKGGEIIRKEEHAVWERLFGKDVAGGVIADTEDGVRRCFNCHWEIVGRECAHCGMHYDSDDFAADAAQGVTDDADGSTDGGDVSDDDAGEDIGYPTDNDDDADGDRVVLDELGDADSDTSQRDNDRRALRRQREAEADRDEMNTDDEHFLADDDEVEFDSDASESIKRQYFEHCDSRGPSRSERRRKRRQERKERKRQTMDLGSSDMDVDGQDDGWESEASLVHSDEHPVQSRRGRLRRSTNGSESDSAAQSTGSTRVTARFTISTDDDEEGGSQVSDIAARSPGTGSPAPRGARRIAVLDDDDDEDAPAGPTRPIQAFVFSSGESDDDDGGGDGPRRSSPQSGSGSSSTSGSSSSSSGSSSSFESSDDDGSGIEVQGDGDLAADATSVSRKRRLQGRSRQVAFKRRRRR